MDRHDFDAARLALAGARRDARAIGAWPDAQLPRDLDEAYRLQREVIGALGAVAGWKIAGVTPAQRETLGVDRPIGAALIDSRVHDARGAPARLAIGDFIAPKLECEVAFELARDLPARPERAYTREEVQAAVAALRLAVEVVDSRLPRGLGTLAEIADGFNNGALVVGPAASAWDAIDFARLEIVLTHEHAGARSEVARGSAKAILDGDPFGTVVLLANAPPDAVRGLRAGDVVTTGSCTGAPPLRGPGRYRAAFAGLGSVEIDFA
jgi:2-keto-4-pentenoate hydratase